MARIDDDQITELKQSIEDGFTDIKQYVDSRISQSENSLETRLESKINARIDDLEETMTSGFVGVGDAIEQIHTVLTDHETRITTLEKAV